MFQNHIQFLAQTIFLIRGDIAVYDNVASYVKGDNGMLSNVLKASGIYSTLLPACSPVLDPIDLFFNVIVQIFSSACNESNVRTSNDVISLLNQIIDSEPPYIFFYTIKNAFANFF